MIMRGNLTSAAVAVALAVVLVAANALAQNGQVCGDASNPLANLDYSGPAVQTCVARRCSATLGTVPTVTTNGFCGGVATAESSVPCNQLFVAYSEYYACLMRSLQGTASPGLTVLGAEMIKFMNTPGFPYHLSPLSCYACNHFRLSVLPLLSSSCTDWTCALISSQSPSASTYGQPDRGYNQRLCSTGCIAAIMMIPFTVVTCAIFLACCCYWPSPSLKTTYEAMLQGEEKDRAGQQPEGQDVRHEPTSGNYSARHEPVSKDV